MNDTVDIHQAADILKVHYKSVLELISDGVLPAGQAGRAYVMMKSDVLTYLRNLIQKQTAQRMGGQPLPKRKRRAATGLPQLVSQV